MQIGFWSATALPMYGVKVDELHLDIDGKRYVVRAGSDGKPVLVPFAEHRTQELVRHVQRRSGT